MDDGALMRDYVERRSEPAFAELVRRHLDLVYSTALRIVGSSDLAEDVAQAVFIQFARKAAGIRDAGALPAWLYRVTRCQAANAARAERTRRERELEAFDMFQQEDKSSAAWEAMAPHLEDAMASLNEQDQNALLQRFFQGRSWREVGMALSLSEDAVQKRATRALEKLRAHLLSRGIAVSSSVIALALTAHAVQAAPSALVSTVTAASFAGAGTASAGATATLKALVMKKTAIGLGLFIGAAVVTTPFLLTRFSSAANADAPVTAGQLKNGLILHMSFDADESGLGRVSDVSGQGNHGRLSGAKWIAGGKNGGAYEFSADGHEIAITNNESLNPEQLTMAAWVRTTTADERWRRIFDKSYNTGYALSIAGEMPGQKWNGQVSLEFGPGQFSFSKNRISDGKWHHIVATCDGATQWIYVDGKPDGNPLTWVEPGAVAPNEFNLVIGCNRSNLTEDDLGMSFRGGIDEPMLWNRVLSAKEVAFLFQSQNGAAQ